MKIRSQLLLVVVISSFVTILLVSSVQIYTTYRQQRHKVSIILQQQAGQLSKHIELQFDKIRQIGAFFVAQPFLQSATPAELQELLETMHNKLAVFDSHALVGVDGKITSVYPFKPELIGVAVGDTDYFRNTVLEKVSQLGTVNLKNGNEQASMVITQPVIAADGQVTAVLLQSLNLDMLQETLNDAAMGDSGQIILFNKTGQFMSSQQERGRSGLHAPELLQQILKNDLREVTEIPNDDGQEMLVAVSRVKTPGWGVAVAIEQAELLQSFYESVKYGLLVFFLIFIGMVIVVSIIFHRLFHSITIVTEHFANLGSSILNSTLISEKVIRSAPQELKKLCNTFNTMVATINDKMNTISQANNALEQARKQLEGKVEVRTQEVVAVNQELTAINSELQQTNDKLQKEIAGRRRIEVELVTTIETLKDTQNHLLQAEKLAALGNLVAGVAHEINTPVGVSITASSYLCQETERFRKFCQEGRPTRKDLQDYLELLQESADIILKNMERAGKLIKSFKQVAVDQSTENYREFNIKGYLEEILLSMQPLLKKSGHKVVLEGDDAININSMPGPFAQIITNLIMNSLHHAFVPQQKGIIRIAVQREVKNILLVYADDGQGMSSEVQARIFEPFFTTKRGAGGTGLGLYIVYNIITQQLQGLIHCESSPGEGTTFMLRLPAEITS